MQMKIFNFGLKPIFFFKKTLDWADVSTYNFRMKLAIKNGTTPLESRIVNLYKTVNMMMVGPIVIAANCLILK